MTLSYVESGVLSKFCQGFKPEGANLRCRLFQQRSTRRRTLGFRSDRNPLGAAHNLKPARARSVRRKPDRRLPLRTLPTRLVSASADCARARIHSNRSVISETAWLSLATVWNVTLTPMSWIVTLQPFSPANFSIRRACFRCAAIKLGHGKHSCRRL